MPGQLEDVLAHSILDLVFSAAAYTPPATWYLAALKSGDVEVTASGYARKAVTNNATNFPAASSRQKLLAVLTEFVAANPGVDWGTVEAIGFYTVVSAGTRQLKISLAGAAVAFLGTASTDVLAAAGHGFIDGQRVRVSARTGVSLPTGIAASTDYYVRDTVAGVSFKLALTAGGAAIDLTTDGAGDVYAWRSKGVSDGDILGFAANDLAISLPV